MARGRSGGNAGIQVAKIDRYAIDSGAARVGGNTVCVSAELRVLRDTAEQPEQVQQPHGRASLACHLVLPAPGL